MPRSRSISRLSAVVALLGFAAACGGGSKGSVVERGPVPSKMCAAGASPVAAAYDLTTGGFQWAACAPGGGLFLMAAVSEQTVWVHLAGERSEYLAFDASTGDELWRGDGSRFLSEVPTEAQQPQKEPPVIDGVRLNGGQDDPMSGINATTGKTLWTRPGHIVYDDVWAVGDGAVFAVESDYVPDDPKPPALVAYEIATGDMRWRREGSAKLQPWHVADGRLLVMWHNLQVLATDDGEVLWETDYPDPPSEFPRMMGGLTNSRSVFVSFTSEWSGGD